MIQNTNPNALKSINYSKNINCEDTVKKLFAKLMRKINLLFNANIFDCR